LVRSQHILTGASWTRPACVHHRNPSSSEGFFLFFNVLPELLAPNFQFLAAFKKWPTLLFQAIDAANGDAED
jgi:hypothetical protein